MAGFNALQLHRHTSLEQAARLKRHIEFAGRIRGGGPAEMRRHEDTERARLRVAAAHDFVCQILKQRVGGKRAGHDDFFVIELFQANSVVFGFGFQRPAESLIHLKRGCWWGLRRGLGGVLRGVNRAGK